MKKEMDMDKPTEDELTRAANRAVKYSELVFDDLRAGVPVKEIILAMWIAAGAVGIPNHMRPPAGGNKG
ncbi:MAG: hypothetical protein OEZ04_02970 [Nitrospinota bacterium]|nr:hypothetical protein [Nitrospinota bacterium]